MLQANPKPANCWVNNTRYFAKAHPWCVALVSTSSRLELARASRRLTATAVMALRRVGPAASLLRPVRSQSRADASILSSDASVRWQAVRSLQLHQQPNVASHATPSRRTASGFFVRYFRSAGGVGQPAEPRTFSPPRPIRSAARCTEAALGAGGSGGSTWSAIIRSAR